MTMTTILELLAMGGYGVYVWPSYAIVLAVLIVNIVAARASLKRAQAEARRRLQAARGES